MFAVDKATGVYFRVFAKEAADTASLRGYVRNDAVSLLAQSHLKVIETIQAGTVSGTVQGEPNGLQRL